MKALSEGDKTSFDAGTLKVNRQEIIDMLMKDQRFSSVRVSLPGGERALGSSPSRMLLNQGARWRAPERVPGLYR